MKDRTKAFKVNVLPFELNIELLKQCKLAKLSSDMIKIDSKMKWTKHLV